MYSVTINYYKNLPANVDNATFFSENVEFSEEFDEFLEDMIVSDSELNLQRVRVKVLYCIISSMRSMKAGNNELFVFRCLNYPYVMWHRITVTGDSLLVEFEEIETATTCYV